MELTQQGLLQELLAPRRDTWITSSFPTAMNEFFSFAPFDDQSNEFAVSNPSLLGLLSSSSDPNYVCPFSSEIYPFLDGLTLPENDTTRIQIQDVYPSMRDDGEVGLLNNDMYNLEVKKDSSMVDEMKVVAADFPAIYSNSNGSYGEKKTKTKKAEGQPSKNLMAERRRRKRLNDRLSMLRSIVPKISKMDRTSILGDTIDYMKELLDKIHELQGEDIEFATDRIKGIKELKANEILIRNPPKFDVERRNGDTQIEICCAPKPGLLLSTVNTLEALGLDVQQCVISCFNDFAMQASCSEAMEHRTMISSEDVKQALFRNAGYGGRCL